MLEVSHQAAYNVEMRENKARVLGQLILRAESAQSPPPPRSSCATNVAGAGRFAKLRRHAAFVAQMLTDWPRL
jgi:hypothetical protein